MVASIFSTHDLFFQPPTFSAVLYGYPFISWIRIKNAVRYPLKHCFKTSLQHYFSTHAIRIWPNGPFLVRSPHTAKDQLSSSTPVCVRHILFQSSFYFMSPLLNFGYKNSVCRPNDQNLSSYFSE